MKNCQPVLTRSLVLVLIFLVIAQFAFISWRLTQSALHQDVSSPDVVQSRPIPIVNPTTDMGLFDDSDYGVVAAWGPNSAGTNVNGVSAVKAGFHRDEGMSKSMLRETASNAYDLQQYARETGGGIEREGIASSQASNTYQVGAAFDNRQQESRGVNRGTEQASIPSDRVMMGWGSFDNANNVFTELAGSAIATISLSSSVPWIELKNGHKLFLGARLNQDYSVRSIQKDSVVLDGPYGPLVISVKGHIIQ